MRHGCSKLGRWVEGCICFFRTWLLIFACLGLLISEKSKFSRGKGLKEYTQLRDWSCNLQGSVLEVLGNLYLLHGINELDGMIRHLSVPGLSQSSRPPQPVPVVRKESSSIIRALIHLLSAESSASLMSPPLRHRPCAPTLPLL